MTTAPTKADIDFEQDLWKASDELRGAVVENQYKDYVLSLIFIKHLAERYEVRKAELISLLEDRDGHGAHENEILFIDASKLGDMASRRLRVFSDKDIEKITSVYHSWRNKNGGYRDIAGLCKSATLDEVKAQDYKLTPGIYVGTENEEDDGIPFEEKMEKLKSKLKDQFERSAVLKATILSNLEDF